MDRAMERCTYCIYSTRGSHCENGLCLLVPWTHLTWKRKQNSHCLWICLYVTIIVCPSGIDIRLPDNIPHKNYSSRICHPIKISASMNEWSYTSKWVELYPPLFQYVFMVWCSVKKAQGLYLYLLPLHQIRAYIPVTKYFVSITHAIKTNTHWLKHIATVTE